MNDDLTTRNTKKDFDEINHLDGEIEPDEEVEGQLVFNTIPDSENYDLIFGLHRSGVANELTWRFTQDDLE